MIEDSYKGRSYRAGCIMDVFIVEDEGMIQELYRDILNMRGHNVIDVASTGEEAIEKFNGFISKPDLIIMDHRMPGMGGLDAARMIMESDPETKIILVSADDNAVWEALKDGIVGMRKPFNIGDLMSAIEIVVSENGSVEKKKNVNIPKPTIKKSGLYLVEESEGNRGLGLFKELILNGFQGISFTRKHPDIMKGQEGMEDVPVIWFTSTPVKGYTNISPLNIQKMLIMIQSAFSKSERSAALVLGFEYILTNIQFDRALNLIQVLNDRVMASKEAVIIFSIDLEVLDERQRRLVLKEFEKL